MDDQPDHSKSTDMPSKTWARFSIHKPPEQKQLQHWKFEDFGGKNVEFVDIDFSYSLFIRAFFHKATFRDCKFIGARFHECVFREATFSNCDFKFAFFDKTIIPYKEVLSNLPEWPNVRRELLQIHRVNAMSLGDYDGEKTYIWEEMRAAKEHYRRARECREPYYAMKYRGFRQQTTVLWKSTTLWLDGVLWGHGEKLYRALISAFVLLIAVAAYITFRQIDSYESQTLAVTAHTFGRAFLFSIRAFLDLQTDDSLIGVEGISILIAIFRWIALGVLVTAIYRRLAHR